mmetsp:Transcript_23435/g.43149  ORF Transcript_23435/g.43149 Transcript_23435/m.43149 type:complete len:355 (-) Transcript_23435:214-1278(-)
MAFDESIRQALEATTGDEVPESTWRQARRPSTPPIGRVDSSKYWDSSAWDPDDRVYVGASEGMGLHQMAEQPDANSRGNRPAPPSKEQGGKPPDLDRAGSNVSNTSATPCGLPRKDSAAYWLADAWDPEERVYVGGDAAGNHRMAVQPDQESDAAKPAAKAGESGSPEVQQRPRLTPAAMSSDLKGTDASSPAGPRTPIIKRGDSSGYWNSDAWDPEERVYVGGDDAGTHRLAVQPDQSAKGAARPRVCSGGDQKVTTPGTEQQADQPVPCKTPQRQRVVSWQESATCPKLPDLVEKVCVELQHPTECGKVLDYLKCDQWIETIDDLRELVDEEWKELRLPARLKRRLRQRISQ